MDERQQPGTDRYEALPAEDITIDQVVAWNIRYYRRARGMTQEELGERVGWSAANVSAAERSVEEHRDRRRFDAQTIAELAIALALPIAALFLPPDDDGQGKRYRWHNGDDSHGMRDLMILVMHNTGEESDVADAYRYRYRAGVTYYVDEQWGEAVGGWFAPMDDKESRLEAAARFRDRQRKLLAMAADDGSVADWLERAADEVQS